MKAEITIVNWLMRMNGFDIRVTRGEEVVYTIGSCRTYTRRWSAMRAAKRICERLNVRVSDEG